MQKALCATAGVEEDQIRDRFVYRAGEEAAEYLFRVASGMQSQIFGEDQILTQVKDALDRARALQCTDGVLEVLFRTAITAAKKAKGRMQRSMVNTNAVDCALQMLRGEGYDFRDKQCLVIGNGRMGKLAAQALQVAGADVTVTVRQYRSGVVEIPQGCRRIDYGQRMERLPVCDLVLSATTSPNITVKYDQLCAGGWKPGAIFVDLAVPRDIDPRIATLPDLRLFDIDSFRVPQSEDLSEVRREAESILAEQLHTFSVWYYCRDLLPAMDRLSARFGADTADRLENTLRTFIPDTDRRAELRQCVDTAARRQMCRLLFSVRDTVGAAAFRQCLETLAQGYDGDPM